MLILQYALSYIVIIMHILCYNKYIKEQSLTAFTYVLIETYDVEMRIAHFVML